MKKKKNSLATWLGVMITAGAGFILVALQNPPKPVHSQSTQTTEWKAPPEANELVNPLKGNPAATEAGKKNFNIYCNLCHGNTGKGDGAAGAGLTPKPGNFTLEKVQKQTDGAIYWKMTNGRAPMAAYKDILKDEQRWQLVNYIRELGKTPPSTQSSQEKKN